MRRFLLVPVLLSVLVLYLLLGLAYLVLVLLLGVARRWLSKTEELLVALEGASSGGGGA